MADEHGDTILRVSTVPYAETFGLNATEITLREYIQYMDRVRKRGKFSSPVLLPLDIRINHPMASQPALSFCSQAALSSDAAAR